MAAVRGKNTRPELLIRKGLHKLGFRYRLHSNSLPGKPDLFLPRYRAAIFVHGCFWHRHNCHLFKLPSTRTEFWAEKLKGNTKRDETVKSQLREGGWRVLTIWECALRGRTRLETSDLLERTAGWITGVEAQAEIRGQHEQTDNF